MLYMSVLQHQFRFLDIGLPCSVAVNEREGRGEQMADSLYLRQSATIHTCYWSLLLCCAPVLKRKDWLDWFLFISLWALNRTAGVGTTYTVKRLCHPGRQYSSLFVLQHLLPFTQAGAVATGARLSLSQFLSVLAPQKTGARAVSTEVLISLCSLSLSFWGRAFWEC